MLGRVIACVIFIVVSIIILFITDIYVVEYLKKNKNEEDTTDNENKQKKDALESEKSFEESDLQTDEDSKNKITVDAKKDHEAVKTLEEDNELQAEDASKVEKKAEAKDDQEVTKASEKENNSNKDLLDENVKQHDSSIDDVSDNELEESKLTESIDSSSAEDNTETEKSKKQKNKKKFSFTIPSKQSIANTIKDTKKYLIITFSVYLLFSILVTIFTNERNNWVIVLQALLYFEIVYAISAVDKKVKKIPNQLIAALMILRIPGLIATIISNPSAWLSAVIAPLLGFLTGAIVVFVLMLLSRGGIGAGDLKLIAVVGLYFGLFGLLEIMIYTMFIASFTGIVLLIMKKAKFKSTMPMAPFICIGSALYIIFAFVQFVLP